MGQDVVIRSAVRMGDVFVLDTDRSFTGQDGQVITRQEGGQDVPALLAERLFDLDSAIDHIYVLQNTVTVRRPGGWDDAAAEAVEEVTQSFLRHYPDQEGSAEEE